MSLRVFLSGSKLHLSLAPALPMLALGVLLATASGFAALGMLWCLVQLTAAFSLHWVAGALACGLLSALLAGITAWVSHHAEAGFAARVKRHMASHLVKLPASTLSGFKGEKLKRLFIEDVSALHHMLAHLPSELATFVFVPIVTLYLLIFHAGATALLALIPGVLAALFHLVVIPKLAAKQSEMRVNVMDDIASAVDDYSRGAPVFRIFAESTGAMQRYHQAAKLFVEGVLERVRQVATSAAIAASLLQAVSTFAIVYAIGSSWEIERLGAALFFSLATVTPALKLGHGLDYFAAGRAAAVRLEDFLQLPPLKSGSNQLPPQETISLQLDSVVPTLHGSVKLSPLDFCFQSGQLTAVTGASGIGKSTMLRMLAGLEPLVAGQIKLAGVPLSWLTQTSLHAHTLLIPQHASALALPIVDNLALGAQNMTDNDYIRALQRAGLNKPLSTLANTLSGGELQRLNLARVFLSKAEVVLLDEPTSALDRQKGQAIFDELCLEAKQKNKVIILVTHDVNLANQADARLNLDTYIQGERACEVR